jgi:hypothetical protein
MNKQPHYADLTHLKDIHLGERIFIVGKGPSLSTFRPFDQFSGRLCIGINNVYKYFPHCRYVVMWHVEVYESDRPYLERQKDFTLYYSSFGKMAPGLPNALDLKYCGDFPLPDREFATVDYWQQHPDEWMFKTTFATGVKLAWWMGAKHITLIGCDFSIDNGYTADDKLLAVPTVLRNYTQEQIFALQKEVFLHLMTQLANTGVQLDRIFKPSELL